MRNVYKFKSKQERNNHENRTHLDAVRLGLHHLFYSTHGDLLKGLQRGCHPFPSLLVVKANIKCEENIGDILVCFRQYYTKNGTLTKVQTLSRPWRSSLRCSFPSALCRRKAISKIRILQRRVHGSKMLPYPMEAHLHQSFSLGRISVFVSLKTYLDRLECEVSIVLLRKSWSDDSHVCYGIVSSIYSFPRVSPC